MAGARSLALPHGQAHPDELGHRILHISQDPGVSDFYITPWEQLVVRRNGKLIYDSFVYQPTIPLEVKPGTHDYAVSMGTRRLISW